MKMIGQIKEFKIADLDKLSKVCLEKIYKGDPNNNIEGLITDAEALSISYKKNRKNKNKQDLQDSLDIHEDAIDVFTNVITVFHNKFTDEKDKEQKEFLRGYVEDLQIHLVRLQNQYNQLIYRKQQYDNRSSMRFDRIAFWVALIFTVTFSILSILFTYFDWKYEKADLQPQIEKLSDSVKILNRTIEQQNEFIKNQCG